MMRIVRYILCNLSYRPMLIMLSLVGRFKKHWTAFVGDGQESNIANYNLTIHNLDILRYVQDLYKFFGEGTHQRITKASEEIWIAYSQMIIRSEMTIEDLLLELGLEEDLLTDGVEKLLGTFI